MKKFIGVKLVEGEFMSSGDYNKSRDWKIPIDENPSKDGLRVIYKDGYVSWCPKKTFEDQNFEITGENNTISQVDVDNMINLIKVYTHFSPDLPPKTIVVQCTLKNGFVITESSTCVDPANYNKTIGTEICMKKIKDKIWFLLSFLLQSAVNGFSHTLKNNDSQEDKQL